MSASGKLPTRKQVILGTLAQFGRRQMLKEWELDSCIAATAIAIDVVKHYGMKAEPFPVTLQVWNPASRKKINELGRLPTPDEKSWQDEGGWSVGVGFGIHRESPQKWPGHLVALVDDEILLDLSVDQANRPQHNIQLGAGGGFVPNFEKFYSGEECHVTESCDCLLIYEAKLGESRYEQSPDWTLRQRRQRVILATIQEIDTQLEHLERLGESDD